MNADNPPTQPGRSSRRGVALLVTLGMIVLLSGIVVAFLVSVRTDLAASKSYEGSTNARLLADSALNLVIAQIREASTQPGFAWVSQPGLIRTFGAGGSPVKSYKLYSARSMVVDDNFNPTTDANSGTGDLPPVLPATDSNYWENQPALWTDLNAPVADLSRTDPFDPTKKKPLMNYPIFDGNHINPAGQMSLNRDPNQDIEGFRVEQYANRGVKMPVRWLYLLKDGTLAPARPRGDNGDVEVLVPAGKEKTAQGEVNSIVARVAFWTDDETAKVNINTASEGTFWDTPVSNGQPGVAGAANYKSVNDSMFEWDLATRMGAQKEYQRYSGHPATTCLSTIFGRQLMLRLGNTGDPGQDRAKMAEEIFKFIPRVTGAEYLVSDPLYGTATKDNSSKAGTARAGGGSGDTSVNIITPDGDRLYASIDEFLYNPNFGANARLPWLLAPAAAQRDTTREMLEMSRFFLTANSKAPEQNLFNQPRVSIWPAQVQDSRRTTFDKLLAFCSTVGPKSGANSLPFYFTRRNADSSGLTPTGAIDPAGDLSARNLALMTYLKGLTSRPIPGWNTSGTPVKTFASKYGDDRSQILTEIFDYIRCTNLADKSDSAAPTASYTQSTASGSAIVFPRNAGLGQSALGQVVPIEMPDGTRGMGRIATISELALVMLRMNPAELSPADRATKAKIQIALVPKYFSPMAGFPVLANNLRFTFKDINITVSENGGSSQPFKRLDPRNAVQPTCYEIGRIARPGGNDSKWGGTLGVISLCELEIGNVNYGAAAPADSNVPNAEMLVSSDPTNKLTIDGSVTVEVTGPAAKTPTNSTGEPVIQTISFKFPKQVVPLPKLPALPPGADPTTYVYNSNDFSYFTVPGTGTGSNQKDFRPTRWYDNGTSDRDVIRSLAAVGNPGNQPDGLQGDMRLVAARKVVSDTYFAPYNPAAYKDPATFIKDTHGLRAGITWTAGWPGSVYGSLVAGMTGYKGFLTPDLPAGIVGVRNTLGQPGDWDTGPFLIRDGPFCNKADEGTAPHAVTGGTQGGGSQYGDSTPYIGDDYIHQDFTLQSGTFFSPNRLIPSAVMFGSLPTGVLANKPWQTLLFRPSKYYLPGGTGQPGSSIEHPGSARYGPPDHLLLDLFWMPVVEPYAISEPFATSGKINLNHQIAPFTHIKRDTGLRAVLKPVKITAMNPDQQDAFGEPFIKNYKVMSMAGKNSATGRGGYGVISRRSIDLDNTLKQITDRLDRNKPFISASEICDIPLIPADVPIVSGLPAPMKPHVSAGFSANTSLSNFDSLLAKFWYGGPSNPAAPMGHRLTGDNALEKPYAYIYPRLTTRSNSYTVHVRVQTLRKNGSDPETYVFKNGRDQVSSEFRGSFLLDRYLDPNLAGFVDANGNPTTESDPNAALGPYRFRVVSSKQFTP